MIKRSKKILCIKILALATLACGCVGGIGNCVTVRAGEESVVTPTPSPTLLPESTPSDSPAPDVTPTPGISDSPESLRIMNLKCEKFDKESITVKWDAIEGTEKYEIWRLNTVTNGYGLVDETEKNTYTFEDLERGEKITILVRGYVMKDDEKVYYMFSDMLSAATIPEDVKNPVIKSTTDSGVTIEWEEAGKDCSYKITKCEENSLIYESVATVKGTSYTDTKVSSATAYTYKISVVVEGTDAVSENEATLVTCTLPQSAFIKQFKGGSFRSRLRWNKISAGDGYIIYMRDVYGQLVEVARITDLNVTEYIHYNLLSDVTYQYMIIPYRIYNGIEYKATEANEVTVVVKGHVATLAKPAVYKKVAKLRSSNLYKKYSAFAKTVKLGKSYVIPGIKITNNLGFECNKMVSQAICFVGDYLLVSAYDIESEETSVVYVLDKKSRKYLCTLSLPDYYHVGGMAFDGTNVWVSTGKTVSCFSKEDVINAVQSGLDSYPVVYKTTCEVKTQASFITYYKKKLWIGEHNEKSTTKMFGYSISGKNTNAPTLTKKCSIKIPSRTQDVAFLKNGTMIISCSNQISAKNKYYISQLMRYKPDWSKKTGYIKAGKCTGKYTMPPMIEGIAYKSGYLYVSFESAAISGCSYKMDRICAMKYKKIKWTK